MTIRRFVYLDETALDQYIAPAEGGSVTEMQSKSGRSGTGGAKLKIGVGEGQIGGDRKNENTWTVTDTPPARFARLLDTLDGEPDWHIIEHPDRQLPEVHTGNLISWSCDVHIPDASNALARSGDGTKALDMVQKMVPIVEEAAPDDPQSAEKFAKGKQALTALTELLTGIDARRTIIGEAEGTLWKIAGPLSEEFIQVADAHDIDGRLTVIGQVTKVLASNRWHPLVQPPFVNRDQRRRVEREGPKPEQQKFYVTGPALILDVLAVYR
ncbi:MAG: hypothetical protein JWR34_5039 [Mycobacterium sp.]|nr:hypothetical protein [Mycobacterium sp.]